jgi:hypothetical protein
MGTHVIGTVAATIVVPVKRRAPKLFSAILIPRPSHFTPATEAQHTCHEHGQQDVIV